MMNFNCPHCGGLGTQKVSAIVNAGTWQGQSEGMSAGVVFTGHGMMPVVQQQGSVSMNQTQLARRLSPPYQPQPIPCDQDSVVWVLVFVGIVFLGITGALMSIGLGVLGIVPFLIALGAGGYAFFLYRHSQELQAAESQRVALATQHWQRQMMIWNELFYCARCDYVFLPQTGHAVPSTHTYQLYGHLQ